MTPLADRFLRMIMVACVLGLSFGSTWAQTTDTLRIATYNILNFPGSTGAQRIPQFQKVLRAMDVDVLVVQEMLSQTGVNSILNNVLNVIEPGSYEAVSFHDGPDTDNACFFKSELFEFVSSRHLSTQLRDINEYVLKFSDGDSLAVLRLYSAHLKASQGSSNEQRRLAEATILRNHLNTLQDGSYFLVMGDMNLYKSEEPAYEMLIGEPDNVGRSFDPIDTPGNWHNDFDFAAVHTQSPRTRQFGGGAPGGMDDRFDFVLASGAMFDTVGFQYLDSSYVSFGNDGHHFNDSINARPNSAVPDSIADALHYASDHLPVFVDLLYHHPESAAEPVHIEPMDFHLYSNFPNPFNSRTCIRYVIATPGHVQLKVSDLLGRRVAILEDAFRTPGTYSVTFGADELASGVYLYSLSTRGGIQVRSMLLIR